MAERPRRGGYCTHQPSYLHTRGTGSHNPMSRIGRFGATFLFGAAMLLGTSDTPQSAVERIWHHRNLGKAYYENPVTQLQAVEEFKQALELSPKPARDQVNYGLALLRAGITKEAIGELEKAQ